MFKRVLCGNVFGMWCRYSDTVGARVRFRVGGSARFGFRLWVDLEIE